MKKDSDETKNNAPNIINTYDKEKKFWLKKLADDPVRSSFPYDHHSQQGVPIPKVLDKIEIPFSSQLSAALIKLGTGKDHRIHLILQAVLALLLKKYTGNFDIIVAAPIYKQEKDVQFINTVLPLCHHVPRHDTITFKELLLQVRETLKEAVEHQNYPINSMVYQLGFSFPEGEFPFSDTLLLMENIHDKGYVKHVKCNMEFTFTRDEDNMMGTLEYNPARYEKSTCQRIANHFTWLMQAALTDIHQTLDKLEMLTATEKQQILDTFNDTWLDYPNNTTINQLFSQHVVQDPNSTALIQLGSGDNEPQIITYGELDHISSQWAYLLRQKGIIPGNIVIIMVDDDDRTHLIQAKLAILKAGAAYLTIDPKFPKERIKFMLDDSNAKTVVTTSDVKANVSAIDSLDVLEIDQINWHEIPATNDIPEGLHPDSLAYVIYTSGSTGRPKGVLIEHKSAIRLVKSTDCPPLSNSTILLQTGSPVFDVISFDVWGVLLNGGQLVLSDKAFLLDAPKLKKAIKQHKVNTTFFTPVLFNQLVQSDSSLFAPLQWILLGGDVLTPSYVNQIRKEHPHANVFDVYGPTENTTFSTFYDIKEDHNINIPIGGPVKNATAYILDSHHNLEPIGVVGELCVGGEGVARGYLNNPQLTAEKFINMPSLKGSNSKASHSIIYKTGDLACWLPNGNIQFLGRRDFQVKILGHRIELGEIESQILKLNHIQSTVVILSGTRTSPVLCAYYVADCELKPFILKNFLDKLIPDYMVPSHFIQLDELPVTATGKIDRKLLPDPKDATIKVEKILQPPSNDSEKAILAVWAEILELDPATISIEDDFFALGGNSINVLKVQNELNKQLNQNVAMSSLFVHPTIKELALAIEKDAKKKTLEYVVKLNKGTGKKNIFIFHQLNGMVFAYKTLAEKLDGQFNVYGIQAKGLNKDVPLPQSVDQIVKDYIPEIRAVQEKGPYILSGYCIGNALAYETARELEDAGETVEQLVLLDVGSSMPEKTTIFNKLKIYFERVLYTLHVLIREPNSLKATEGENEEQNRLIQRVKYNNMKVVSLGYKYKRIVKSPIIHIRASKNFSLRLFQKTWAKMSESTVTFFSTPGHHFNIFEHPRVDTIAKIFQQNVPID
jgi:amino acid adenylation domain-containing protein